MIRVESSTRFSLSGLTKKALPLIKDNIMSQIHKFVAGLLDHIDFGCNFNENGVCSSNRKHIEILEEEFNQEVNIKKYNFDKGRCSSCAEVKGYLEKDFYKVKDLFDKKSGFWRDGIGCILPREDRSIPCSFFYCQGEISRFDKLNLFTLETMNYQLMSKKSYFLKLFGRAAK